MPISLIIAMIVHLLLIILRGTEVIKWSWWIICIPELLFAVGIMEMFFFVFLDMIREWNRRRIHNGK